MTYETLLFLRQVLDQLSLPVSDPKFRTVALAFITAIDELDAEIEAHNASNTLGRDIQDPFPA